MDVSISIMSLIFTAVLLSSGPQGFATQRSKEFGSIYEYVAAEFQNAVGCKEVVRNLSRIRFLIFKENVRVAA